MPDVVGACLRCLEDVRSSFASRGDSKTHFSHSPDVMVNLECPFHYNLLPTCIRCFSHVSERFEDFFVERTPLYMLLLE